ncbi:SH3 domain-containing protein [Gongronella butleri]|nr:SH3 domain-containing protein [Gongronella butleri]
MTETFKALYDYEAQGPDEVSFRQGDALRVVSKDNDDWWTIEASGNQGLAPSNYLEKDNQAPQSPQQAAAPAHDDGPLLAKVVHEYEAQDSQEISLRLHGVVTVVDQAAGDGWWKGETNGKMGLFPSSHVKIIDAKDHPLEEDKTKRQSFKLAAYGVKQGGIGSILAGGMGLRKKGGPAPTKHDDQPPTTTTPSPPPAAAAPTSEQPAPSAEQHEQAIVLNAYIPQQEDELALLPGAYITITDKMDNAGWWRGHNEKNEQGVFPMNFVKLIPSTATAPVRPQRSRPPTIQTDASPASPSNSQLTSPTSMAKPPPVPVATRPTSLKTQTAPPPTRRPPTNPEVPSTPVQPPPRPITSPPVPSRRSISKDGITPPPRPNIPHKRTPSIPMASPDLPPPTTNAPHDHPTRPSRPVPMQPPTTTPAATPLSPTSEMAKPPKNFPKPPSVPSPASRPTSMDEPNANSATVVPPPRAPKRSMPPVPAAAAPNAPPTTSSPAPMDDNASVSSVNAPATATTPPPHTRPASDDPLEAKLHQWFDDAVGQLRAEFEMKLEEERTHRLRLEEELDTLKQHLYDRA